MNRLLKNCGLTALVMTATCLSFTEVEAGGRRNACHCQTYSAAPATTYSAAPAATAPATASTTADVRQRYQSAYQAPADVTVPPVYVAPANNYYYRNTQNQPLRFQDRSFHDQWDAGRKIRGL